MQFAVTYNSTPLQRVQRLHNCIAYEINKRFCNCMWLTSALSTGAQIRTQQSHKTMEGTTMLKWWNEVWSTKRMQERKRGWPALKRQLKPNWMHTPTAVCKSALSFKLKTSSYHTQKVRVAGREDAAQALEYSNRQPAVKQRKLQWHIGWIAIETGFNETNI